MNTFSKIAIVTFIASLTLSACGTDNDDKTSDSSITSSTSEDSNKSSTKNYNSDTVAYPTPEEAATSFFSELQKNSSKISEDAQALADGGLIEILDEKMATDIYLSSNPVPVVESLSEENQKKAANAFKELIPDTIPLNYTNLSDAESVLAAGAVAMMGSSMANMLDPSVAPVKDISNKDVEMVDEKTALVEYYESGADESNSDPDSVRVVKTDNGWVLDARGFYDKMIAVM